MKKYLIISSLVVLLLAGWRYQLSADDMMAAQQSQQSQQAQPMPSATAQPHQQPAPAAPVPPPPSSQAAQAAWRAQNEMKLERRVTDYRSFKMDGRNWAVLGSRTAEGSAGAKQTVLVLRDEISGQLAYRQSALRLVLRDGLDYESFIREHSKARRQFVNPLYAEIAVDLADISDQYVTLANDQRVTRLDFIPLLVPAKAK